MFTTTIDPFKDYSWGLLYMRPWKDEDKKNKQDLDKAIRGPEPLLLLHVWKRCEQFSCGSFSKLWSQGSKPWAQKARDTSNTLHALKANDANTLASFQSGWPFH